MRVVEKGKQGWGVRWVSQSIRCPIAMSVVGTSVPGEMLVVWQDVESVDKPAGAYARSSSDRVSQR